MSDGMPRPPVVSGGRAEGLQAQGHQRRSNVWSRQNHGLKYRCGRPNINILTKCIITIDGHDRIIRRAGRTLGLGGGRGDGCVRWCAVVESLSHCLWPVAESSHLMRGRGPLTFCWFLRRQDGAIFCSYMQRRGWFEPGVLGIRLRTTRDDAGRKGFRVVY